MSNFDKAKDLNSPEIIKFTKLTLALMSMTYITTWSFFFISEKLSMILIFPVGVLTIFFIKQAIKSKENYQNTCGIAFHALIFMAVISYDPFGVFLCCIFAGVTYIHAISDFIRLFSNNKRDQS